VALATALRMQSRRASAPETAQPPERTRTPVSGVGSTATTDEDEAALIALLRGRNEAAFARLVRMHHAALVRLAATFVASTDVANDVVQDTWLAVFHGLFRFEGRSSLRSWIYAILVNHARTRGVRERRSVPLSSLDAATLDTPDAEYWPVAPADVRTPEALLGVSRMRRSLEDLIRQLPVRQRAVFWLRDVEGVDAASVCRTLGITPQHERVLRHRARARIRKAWQALANDG
jgi:RNA polymerase sigma-70 factor (ECF subfamily)